MATTSTLKSSPRVRFNWGFWDGRNDGLAKRSAEWNRYGRSHFDKIYEKGYWAGRATANDDPAPTSSDPAWREEAAKIREAARQRHGLVGGMGKLLSQSLGGVRN